MSYSTTVMIPPLKEAQNSIYEMEKRFPKAIRYNGTEPTKARIDRFYSKLSDALYRYNIARSNVINLREERLSSTRMYFTIFMILLWVGGVALGGIFLYDFIKKRHLYSKLQWLIAFFIGCIVITMFGVSTQYAVTMRDKSNKINKNLYGPDPFVGTDYIGKLTEMMEITFPKSGQANSLTINSNNPALVMTVVKQRNITLKDKSKIGNESCKTTLCTDPKSATFEKCNAFGDDVFPFTQDNRSPLVPSMGLRKELDAFDLYGQLKRLRDAVTYIKGFVLKSSDVGGTDTTQPVLSKDTENYINRRVVDAILTKYYVLDDVDLYVYDTKKIKPVVVSNQGECHATCLNDVSCLYAGFDEDSSTCATVPADSGTFLRYKNRTDNKVKTLVKGSKPDVTVYSDALQDTTQQFKAEFQLPSQASQANQLCGNSCISKTSKLLTRVADASADMYDYTLTSGTSSIANIAADKSYSDILVPTTAGTLNTMNAALGTGSIPVTGYFHTATTPSLANSTKGDSFINNLTNMRDYYVQLIVNTVLENDPTGSFVFTDANIDYVIKEISRRLKVGVSQYDIYIRDLFSDIPDRVQAALFAKMADEKDGEKNRQKYVPFERFVSKLQDLSKESFMKQFVMNVEEIRATSNGINNLNKRFNMAQELNSIKNSMTDLVLLTIIIVGVFGVIIVLLSDIDSETKRVAKIVKEGSDFSKVSRYLSITLKVAIVASIVIIIYHMVYGNRNKRDTKFQYNRTVLETNGIAIVNQSNTALETIYDLFVENKFQNRSDPKLVQKKAGTSDMIYDTMYKQSDINAVKKISVASTDPNMIEVYDSLINIVDSFDKCNSLVTDNMINYPFPVLDVSLYVIVIIICLIALLVVFGQMDPIGNIQEIKKYTIIKSRLTRSLVVDTADIGCYDSSKEMDEQMIITLKLIAIALVIVFAIAFAQSVQNNADIFSSGLYGSDLFVNSECFGL